MTGHRCPPVPCKAIQPILLLYNGRLLFLLVHKHSSKVFCKEIKDLFSSSSQNTSNQGTILSCPNREMGRKRQKKKENFVEVWYKMQSFSMCLETALKSILPHCSLILPILLASSVAKLLQEPLFPFCWCFSAPHLCDRFPSSCRRCTSLH